jgi:hypothetical protein
MPSSVGSLIFFVWKFELCPVDVHFFFPEKLYQKFSLYSSYILPASYANNLVVHVFLAILLLQARYILSGMMFLFSHDLFHAFVYSVRLLLDRLETFVLTSSCTTHVWWNIHKECSSISTTWWYYLVSEILFTANRSSLFSRKPVHNIRKMKNTNSLS